MNDHSPTLDTLRAVAVLFVVISHLLIEHLVTSIGSFHTQSLGTLGVYIFFVHTCLVLMQSLGRHERLLGKPPTTLSFLVTRAFRIYPLSILIVVLVASTDRLFFQTHPGLFNVISNILLIQNLTGSASVTPVLWSLPYEFQMYLFLPVLFFMASSSSRHAWRWVFALWCACVVLVLLFRHVGISVELIRFFPCFLPGVLAYCLLGVPRSYSPTLLFAYVGAVAVIFPMLVGLGASATVMGWVICLVLGALIPRCGEVRTRWLKRCAAVIARYSYGIYLVHVPIMKLSFRYVDTLPGILSWLLFIGGVALASYLAYHTIEQPGIAYGRVLAQRLNISASRPARRA